MKTKIYLILIATLLSSGMANARPVDKVKKNPANWSDPTAWTLGRIPQNGDSVVIPAGDIFTLDISVSLNNLYLNVAGVLTMNNTSLTLDNASVVNLLTGGMLFAFTSNEFISIGGVKKFTGNLDFIIFGPEFANKNTGVSPNGFSNNMSLLPVTFVSFTATRENNQEVVISWSTANEINNSHFEIERSTDGTNWEVIAKILPGTSSLLNTYQYTDMAATASTVFYRIRQVDLDENYMYSKIEVVKGDLAKTTATIIAANKNITIRLNNEMRSTVVVRLISMNGQVLQQQSFDASSTVIDFHATGVTTGIYVVQVLNNGGLLEAKKVLL